jgi:hypothetical protein
MLVGMLLLVSAIYVAAITPSSFGFYLDDGVYMVKAKALATGHGYRILSLPGEPVDKKSPLYPVLLSLVWRMFPAFPDNLTVMMMMSVCASLASLVLVFKYLTKFEYSTGWQALTIVALTAFNWRLVLLGSSVYSETTYTLLSIAALYLAEGYGERESKWFSGVFTGLILGLAFLTREVGVALIIAVGIFYFQRRKFSSAALVLAVAFTLVLGWVAWAKLNGTSGGTAIYNEDYLNRFASVISRAASRTHQSELRVVLGIISNNALMLVLVSPPLMCLGLPYDWAHRFGGPQFVVAVTMFSISLIMIGSGFLRTRKRSGTWRLTHVYVLSYVVFHLAWPYDGYERFLIPLLPFLFLFLVNGLTLLVQLVRIELAAKVSVARRSSAAFIGLSLLMLTVASGYVGFIGLRGILFYSKTYWDQQTSDYLQAVEWIKSNTNSSDILICPRDTSYSLYSGRKAVLLFPFSDAGLLDRCQPNDDEAEQAILRIIKEHSPAHLVVTSAELAGTDFVYYRALQSLIEHHPETLVLAFKSGDGRVSVYRIWNGAG